MAQRDVDAEAGGERPADVGGDAVVAAGRGAAGGAGGGDEVRRERQQPVVAGGEHGGHGRVGHRLPEHRDGQPEQPQALLVAARIA
ncbi:hypothetical protein [Actinomadura rifamycini]|uniref:hypothetical protein n=1 Tax=Actinomadura rifamycini TaxID=31962 RepID=UPI000479B3F2|nr:hypothetical protein [Actinomadura rifamycini]